MEAEDSLHFIQKECGTQHSVDKRSSSLVVEFEGEDDFGDVTMANEKAKEIRKYFGVQ